MQTQCVEACVWLYDLTSPVWLSASRWLSNVYDQCMGAIHSATMGFYYPEMTGSRFAIPAVRNVSTAVLHLAS